MLIIKDLRRLDRRLPAVDSQLDRFAGGEK